MECLLLLLTHSPPQRENLLSLALSSDERLILITPLERKRFLHLYNTFILWKWLTQKARHFLISKESFFLHSKSWWNARKVTLAWKAFQMTGSFFNACKLFLLRDKSAQFSLETKPLSTSICQAYANKSVSFMLLQCLPSVLCYD